MTKNIISHVLKADSKTLSVLLSQLNELQKLQGLFVQYLEPHLAKHCEVARYHQDKLIVITDTGSWATQLQFRIPELLEKLKTHLEFQNIKAICCKIRPKVLRDKKQSTRQVSKLSQETAELILQMTGNIQDEDLRAVFARIASHRK